MSRSRKKTAITGITTSESEAFDKRTWHKALRKAENSRIVSDPDSEALDHKSFSDKWTMSKDGKQLFEKSDPFYEKAKRK